MSWILKQLSGAIGPYIMVALAVIIVGLSITTKVLWSSNTDLQKELAVSKANAEALTSANTSNQKAISELRNANEKWATMFDSYKIKDELAAQDMQRLRDQLEAASLRAESAIRRERQEPDCAAIMAIDIQRACPVHAQRMRDDAATGTF